MFCYENKEVISLNKICLCGIGAAGENIVAEAIPYLQADDFACAMDLDARRLNAASITNKVHLGAKLTKGLGSSGDRTIALSAAEESTPAILRALEGADMVLIACGLGGGTGSGVAPEVARLAKEQGSLVISVAVSPFAFEGAHRRRQASEALSELSRYSDLVLRFCNDHIESLVDNEQGILGAFNMVNSLLARAMMLIPNIARDAQSILHVGMDDVLNVVGSSNGVCSFGVAEASLGTAPDDISARLTNSPLFLDAQTEQLKDVLVLIQAGTSFTISDLSKISTKLSQLFTPDVNMRLGVTLSDNNDKLIVSVLGVLPEDNVALPHEQIASIEPVSDGNEQNQIAPPPIHQETPVLAPLDNESALDEFCPTDVSSLSEEPTHEEEIAPSPVELVSIEAQPNTEIHEEAALSHAVEEIPPAPVEETEEFIPSDDGTRGLFDILKPNILDGEDLDLPPSLRKKK